MLAKPKVVILKQLYDRYEKVQKILEPVADIEFSVTGSSVEELYEKKKQLSSAEGFFGSRINEEFLLNSPKLKVVANYSVGYDSNDVDAMTKHKVYLTNTPGVLSDAVADLTLALMLAVNKKIVQCDKYVREGAWAKRALSPGFSYDLKDKTVGVIGLGRIGYETAKRCVKGFDMKIIYFDLNRNLKAEAELGAKQKTLEEVLGESDCVVVHTDLNAQTKKMIGEKQLRMMRKTAIIIDAARGPIIDQVALAKVLSEGVIAGAGLDIFDAEPCPEDDPILRAPNTVFTPHMGSATYEAREAMVVCNAEDMVAVLKGQVPPPNVVPEQREMIFQK